MVHVIGAGLAGVEAAYFLANNGIKVKLFEMRPHKMTDAHKTAKFAELVCSNSLRSKDSFNAVGMLKEEMKLLGSLVMESALKHEVEAGSSLAVDRESFSSYITNKIKTHPNIEVINEEVKSLDLNIPTIIATGPLVSLDFANYLKELFKLKSLAFYDAVAPIIERKSIDMNVCYYKSRYDIGEASYINCPMNKEEYELFQNELIKAEGAPLKDFEIGVFEGCLPIEEMAKRGKETLLFGPLKPVGLKTEKVNPYAVVQLRQDDALKEMYNLVGFQTNLKFGEQKRIISLIPGLEKANILRYGVMHKNTYLPSPLILNNLFQVKNYPNLFIAGQISGVEGYVESASSGLVASYHMLKLLKNEPLVPFPLETMMGALSSYISITNNNFNPMNANLGLLPYLEGSKKDRKRLYYERSINALTNYLKEFHER